MGLFSKFSFCSFLSLFLLLILSINVSYSAVAEEVFSDYSTHIKLNSDETIEISKKIILTNVGVVAFVPGQVEFKISNDAGDLKILNYSVINKFGKSIRNNLVRTGDSSVIVLEIFQPLLPGFDYEINLAYNLSYVSSGIVFKKFQIPLSEKSRIPIKKGKVSLEIPSNLYLTYVDYLDNSSVFGKNTVNWEINENTPSSVFFEYSYLPIKIGNMQGSTVFWIIVNVILIFLLVREIRKHLILNQ